MEERSQIHTEIVTADVGSNYIYTSSPQQIDASQLESSGGLIAYVDNQAIGLVPFSEATDVDYSVGRSKNYSTRQSMSLVDLGKRLLHASRLGDVDQVRQLMASGAPFTTDWLGTSPLHFAAHSGHLATADTLLRAGISRDARTKVDRTPLHCACQEGHRHIVETLLKHGADVDAKDMLKMTPIHWAVERNHLDVVELLLKHGADITQEDKFDRTPVHVAVQNDRMAIAHLLQTSQANSVESAVHQMLQSDHSLVIETADPVVEAATMASQTQLSTPLPITHRQKKPQKPKHQSARASSADANSTSVLATLAALAEATAPSGTQGLVASQDAVKWLETHGITMVTTDEHVTGDNVGGTGVLTLTEAGKLALNLVKEQNVSKQGSGDGSSSYTLSTDENGQEMITIVTDGQQVITSHDDDYLQSNKRIKIMSSDDSASEEQETSLDSMNAEELKRHLEEMQKQARQYKLQLQRKEQEAAGYKRKLDEITGNRSDSS